MLIINLKGGLGNQLFQYAAGRALALRIENSSKEKTSIVKLDINGYGHNNGIDTMRHYALSSFNIRAEIASNDEIKKLKYPLGIISKGWRFFKTKGLRQFNVNFNESIFNSNKSIYFDGFFQTEKYFIDFEEQIRQEFTLKNPLSTQASKMAELINYKNSVSLHIRRGDYVNDKNTNLHHGTCGIEYYEKALEYLKSKLSSIPYSSELNIFVFSDDIKWAKENLKFDYPTVFVSSTEIPDYEELILMSKCKHNIIANSSFSWWGAWLNQNRDKIVIAPKRWVLKGEKNYRDIIPNTWQRI